MSRSHCICLFHKFNLNIKTRPWLQLSQIPRLDKEKKWTSKKIGFRLVRIETYKIWDFQDVSNDIKDKPINHLHSWIIGGQVVSDPLSGCVLEILSILIIIININFCTIDIVVCQVCPSFQKDLLHLPCSSHVSELLKCVMSFHYLQV